MCYEEDLPVPKVAVVLLAQYVTKSQSVWLTSLVWPGLTVVGAPRTAGARVKAVARKEVIVAYCILTAVYQILESIYEACVFREIPVLVFVLWLCVIKVVFILR